MSEEGKSVGEYRELVERKLKHVISWASASYEWREDTLARRLVMEIPPPGCEKEWGALFDLLAQQKWVGAPTLIMDEIAQKENVQWAHSAMDVLPLYLMVSIYGQAKTEFLARIMEQKTQSQTARIIDKIIGSIGDVERKTDVELDQSAKRDVVFEQTAMAMVRYPGLLGKISSKSRRILTEHLDYVGESRQGNAVAIKRELLAIVVEQGNKGHEARAGKNKTPRI